MFNIYYSITSYQLKDIQKYLHLKMSDTLEMVKTAIGGAFATAKAVGQVIRPEITIKNSTNSNIHIAIDTDHATDESSFFQISPKTTEKWGRKAGTYKVKIILIEFSMTKKLI